MDLHWEILDKQRLVLLPGLRLFKDTFYLAGGTAAALYLGHRDSVDFDFFTEKEFNHSMVLSQIKEIFTGKKVEESLAQPNTILLKVDDVEMSFFKYPYVAVGPFFDTENVKLASLADIGCMKLTAISDRHKLRDYIDLYAICQKVPLKELLKKAEIKFPGINSSVFIRSLSYYADIDEDRKLIFKNNFYVDLKTIESFFRQEIKQLFEI